jgi:type II secretory pathway pseudopilin PulG
MAGSKLTDKHSVKGSTILEVIISMIIIIVVFGIAMMIFTNVNRLSLSVKKLKAQAILQQALLQAEQANDHTDQTITVDDLIVKQEITPFENESGLSIITLTAFDPNHEQIARLKKVIASHEE